MTAFLCDTCLSFFYTYCTSLLSHALSSASTSLSLTPLFHIFKFQIHNSNFRNPNSTPLSYSLPQHSALSFSLLHRLSNSHCHNTSLFHSHSAPSQIQTLPIALTRFHGPYIWWLFFKKG